MAREWAAKHFVFAAVTLVIGLVIGGLGPRAEVRSLRARLDDVESQPRARAVGRELANVFRGRPWEGEAPSPSSASPTPSNPRGPTDPGDDEPEAIIADDAALVENIDRMKEAMEIRRTQAIAALREQAEA